MTESSDITHKTVILSLDKGLRKSLLERSDWAGLKQSFCHFSLIGLCSLYILLKLPLWQIVMIPQGVLLVFLFTALHETIHATAFKTPWLNSVVAHFCGVVLLLPVIWFRQFHFEHHRHTNNPELDPELAQAKPTTLVEYITYLSGIPVFISLLKTLFNNALGKNSDRFINSNLHKKITLEASVYLSLYILLITLSITFNATALIYLWSIPIVIGQPFLRAYLLAEHALCPEVDNMLINSRTTLSNAFIRFIAWNMPYHAEHHSLPSVPFYKLPEFHQHLKHHLGTVDAGYSVFHKEFQAKMLTRCN